ncbi:MAG: DUF1559 domain-containing protein [Pirellulales bacterium]|nr:DUF1559 domain-containing protein [Pirellulales bacterium]
MEPLSITCTTCNTRLRVRDKEALGKILACPRCGGMVQVPAKEVQAESAISSDAPTATQPTGVASTPNDAGLELSGAAAQPGRRPWILGACGVLLLTIAAVAGWALLSSNETPPSVAVAPIEKPVTPIEVAEPPADRTLVEVAPPEASEEPAPVAEEPPPASEQPSDARGVDDANHQRLAEALQKHAAEQGEYPVGAAGTPQLPATERLSWIATLLPYYGHEDWHASLNFRRSWKDEQNRPITTQKLSEVTNPALTPLEGDAPEAEFPATHYVGVAGVGADAGDLPIDHPRAGVFGFQRRVRSTDIPDGASNTIAVLGASGNLGPWSAGGAATVRPLTQAPYVNGPDGFGSGTPDGLAAGMADGSVRFFSKDVDPRVLEQMATIAGHEAAPVETPLAGPARAPANPTADGAPAAVEASPSVPTADTPLATSDDEPWRAAVEARLADPLLELAFTEIALSDFVDFISQLSTLEITLDLDALAEAGVTPDLKFSIHLAETTVGDALKEGLAELGLAYTADAGRLVVSSPRRIGGQLRLVRYRVGDLTGSAPASVEAFAELVRTLVEPATWSEAGGAGTLELVGDALLVRQSDATHYDLLVLCEKLRVARGGRPASVGDPSRFALASRSQQAQVKLDTPLRTVNFGEGTPLTKIVDFLQSQARVNLTIDWQALAPAGISREVTASLVVANVPLGEALTRLLEPLELDYLVVGPRTFQITSKQQAASRRELEIYPVRDLLDGSTDEGTVVARLTSGLAGVVVARFDRPSASVLLLAPQTLQREVEARLTAWRAEQSPAKQDAAAATPGEAAKTR